MTSISHPFCLSINLVSIHPNIRPSDMYMPTLYPSSIHSSSQPSINPSSPYAPFYLSVHLSIQPANHRVFTSLSIHPHIHPTIHLLDWMVHFLKGWCCMWKKWVSRTDLFGYSGKSIRQMHELLIHNRSIKMTNSSQFPSKFLWSLKQILTTDCLFQEWWIFQSEICLDPIHAEGF